MTLSSPAPKLPELSLFRVEFIGGASVVTKAKNSIKAEQSARRLQPGIVAKVRILKGTRP